MALFRCGGGDVQPKAVGIVASDYSVIEIPISNNTISYSTALKALYVTGIKSIEGTLTSGANLLKIISTVDYDNVTATRTEWDTQSKTISPTTCTDFIVTGSTSSISSVNLTIS